MQSRRMVRNQDGASENPARPHREGEIAWPAHQMHQERKDYRLQRHQKFRRNQFWYRRDCRSLLTVQIPTAAHNSELDLAELSRNPAHRTPIRFDGYIQ